MLPADLLTIGRVVEVWTTWFEEDYMKGKMPELGVKLTLVMNNPHYYKE
jgi:hypothetical protein